MKLDFVRPDASQLAFRLFERSLHPELFDRYAEALLTAEGFSALLRICEGGHTIEFRCRGEVLTEVMGPYDQDLPERGRCFGYRLRGCRDAAHAVAGAVRYQCSTQVEQLDPEVFSEVHTELKRDAEQAFLSYDFPTSHRFLAAPLSLLQGEVTSESLIIHAFHTFPESGTVLRTQSLFEF
jgi:hypothetical protein